MMFTLAEIQTIHGKVKSGADFPNYIQELKVLGVTFYVVQVCDGSTEYKGSNSFSISSEPKYGALKVATTLDKARFQADLKSHQLGNTDYFQFCQDCAKSGIHRWDMDIGRNTCTYFDVNGQEVLKEQIPI